MELHSSQVRTSDAVAHRCCGHRVHDGVLINLVRHRRARAMRETSERVPHRTGLPASHHVGPPTTATVTRTGILSYWALSRAWSRYPSLHGVRGWYSSSQFAWDGATQRSYTPSPFFCVSAANLEHTGMFWLCWEGTRRLPWFTLLVTKRCRYFASPSFLVPVFVVCGGVFPWRKYMSNIVDITTNAGFLLMLFLDALLVEGADKALIADMLTAIFFFFDVQFLGPGDLELSSQDDAALGQYVSNFFLCHYEQGGGCFTRLLELRLKRDLRVKREIFPDAD